MEPKAFTDEDDNNGWEFCVSATTNACPVGRDEWDFRSATGHDWLV